MVTPLVTVIIPTHQRIPLLRSAVESVINQTFADFECLVISDCPHEHPLVQGEISGIGDPRIRFLPSAKPGANASRNLGLASARGDIVAYLDDDDEWLPEKLDRHVRAHETADFVFSKVIYRYHAKAPFDLISETEPNLQNAAERMRSFDFCPPSSTCVSVRVSYARENPWDENLMSYQDWDVWYRILSAGARVGYLPEPLAIFNQRRIARTSKGFRKRMEALAQLETKYQGSLGNAALKARRRLEFSRNIYRILASEGLCKTWKAHRKELGFDVAFLRAILTGFAIPECSSFWLIRARQTLKRLLGSRPSKVRRVDFSPGRSPRGDNI